MGAFALLFYLQHHREGTMKPLDWARAREASRRALVLFREAIEIPGSSRARGFRRGPVDFDGRERMRNVDDDDPVVL